MSPIVVRHTTPADATALFQLYSHAETQANTLHLPLQSPALWQERLQTMRPGEQRLVACIDGQIVGQLTLSVLEQARRRHTATLGMGVDPAFHRRGVGSALMAAMVDLCDNWLQVTRIELTVFADNAAAIGLYKKFGFEREGTARRHAMRNGELVDTDYMARLKG
ncbi:GNAT family N-acetyltransferase [Pantoea cypripedii]|uniref:GNAT family N-acetyltransferase n=1 Tax=Pantoea cypripedii TaxID=55209 RepID=A0A1X1EPW2_PANCY|nr:GNAT family N-acetyltransferase [Pantoea cypripedii]MBP2196070.1 putative acetyltransferase [Pantoea cypripedii]ORM92028.1 GNAT family N-acetyltransferase [Pantoea cypripedii]